VRYYIKSRNHFEQKEIKEVNREGKGIIQPQNKCFLRHIVLKNPKVVEFRFLDCKALNFSAYLKPVRPTSTFSPP
jgi:hypothetical protein